MLRSSARLRRACGARPRAYPAGCSAVLGKLERALSAGRSATRFAGSAMLEMLSETAVDFFARHPGGLR